MMRTLALAGLFLLIAEAATASVPSRLPSTDWIYDAAPLLTGKVPRDTLEARWARAQSARARPEQPNGATWMVDTASTHIRLDMPRQLRALGDSHYPLPALFALIADLDGDAYPEVVSTSPASDSVLVFLDEAADATERRIGAKLPGLAFALALADVDADGRLDLVCSTWSTDQLAVLRGLGNGSFAAPSTFAAGPGTRGLALADLDADGDLDIAVACADDSTLRVFLGDGSGAFAPSAAYPVGRQPALVIAADVTGDGRPDLISMNQAAATLSCLVNLGGGFAAPVTSPLIGRPFGIAAGDLDADGHDDIAVSTDAGSAVMWGDGAGGFGAGPVLSTRSCPQDGGVAIADLDGDGRLDVITGESGVRGPGAFAYFGAVHVFHGLGGGAFEKGPSYRSVANLQSVSVGDIDHDGLPDIVACGAGAGYTDPRPYISVLIQRPDHRLRSLTEYGTPGVGRARAARLGGSVDDLVAVIGGHVQLMVNQGVRGFAPAVDQGPGTIALVRDLDHDGLDDVLVKNGDALSVLRGTGGHAFTPAGWSMTGYVFLAAGEFTGDALPDLIVRDATGILYLARGLGAAVFQSPVTTQAYIPSDPISGLSQRVCNSADLDHDGLDELLVFRQRASSAPDIGGEHQPDTLDVYHLAPGNSLLPIASYPVPWPTSSGFNDDLPNQILPADFNGDGWPDLLAVRNAPSACCSQGSYAAFLNQQGAGTLQVTAADWSGRELSEAAIVDLDGDLRDDVVMSVIYSDDTGRLDWLVSRGDGTFAKGRRDDVGDYLTSITVGRFDEDSHADIAVTAGRDMTVNVVLNATPWPDRSTPVLASLVSASIDAGVARLTWSTDAAPAAEAIVLRSLDGAEWSERARLHPDGDGRVRFEDAALAPGQRVGYRLAFTERGALVTASETWLAVPVAARLALAGARPNPVAGDLMVAFSLAHRTPGTLALFDLAGRRIAEQDVSAFAPGEHRVRLAAAGAVRPGLYFIRLVTPERTLTTRAIVVS